MPLGEVLDVIEEVQDGMNSVSVDSVDAKLCDVLHRSLGLQHTCCCEELFTGS
jgi:hypothetical protein